MSAGGGAGPVAKSPGQSEGETCAGGIGWSSLLSEPVLGARPCHVGCLENRKFWVG